MDNHTLDYKLEIIFHKDGIKTVSTGESLTYEKLEVAEASLRHRHTKLVNTINDVIRQYIKDNQ